jgi:hypothetical protein
MKQQSLRIIILLLFLVLMLVPIQLVRAEHWVEVVRFEGRRDIFTTAPFVCNYSVWRIRYESYSGDRFPMIIPGVYTLNITIYRQGETTDYIDRISEEPTQGMYYYHLIRNNTGSFYMNISTGYSDSYSIIIEQNTDSVFVTPTPIPSPTPINSNTENNSASPLGLSLEIIAALVVMFVAAFTAVLLVLRRKSLRRNLMPKKLLATTIILTTILALVVGIQVVEVVDANPLPPNWMASMTITIHSPLKGVINDLPLLVNFSAQSSPVFYLSDTQTDSYTGDFFYVLDGQSMSYGGTKIANTQMIVTSQNKHQFSGQTYIPNLIEGPHNITVYWGASINNRIYYDESWSTSIQFYVINENPSPTPKTTLTPNSPIPSPSPSPTSKPNLTQSPVPTSQTPTPFPTPTPITTPTQVSSNYLLDQVFLTAIAIVIVIVAVASIALVYFRRSKGKP